MELLVSKYCNNSVASKKKHIFSRLFDYFGTFVVTYLLFSIVSAIGSNLPVVREISQNLQNANQNALIFVDSSKLQTLNTETNQLESIESGALKYVENVAKTNAYIYEQKYLSLNGDGTIKQEDILKENTFLNDLVNYDKDNLSFYYKKFKTEHEGLDSYIYDGADYSLDKDTYMYLKIMGYDAAHFVSEIPARATGASKFIVLSSENTTKLIRRVGLKETTDPVANALYTEITNGYIKAVQYGVSDVQTNSAEYQVIMDNFNASYNRLSQSIVLMYFIAYFLAYVILTVVLRLISKEWVTLGQKVMGLAVINKDETDLQVWKLILYHVINFVLFSSSAAVGFFFLGSFGALSMYITPHITMLTLVIAILTLNLFSLFMPIFTKKHDDLSTLVMGVSVVDKNEFEANPEVLATLEEGDKQ